MADNSRSLCPWDPSEVCKAAHGACLPPRKRLLAGLKQNGWLSSTPPYFKGASETSCAPEELKLEVDLTVSKHDCTADIFYSESPTFKQGEGNTVEEPVSVSLKRKRAIKRRKSLSVLADCRISVKNLQPELLKSCSGGEIHEKTRTNKVFSESLPNPKREKARYNELLDAARATAAKAAKEASEAKSIALEKAAVAAKAAAIARAALEAVALTSEKGVLECQPSRNGWVSCEQNRIGKELEGGPKLLSHPHLLVSKNPTDKKSGYKRTSNSGANFIESKDDGKMQADQSPTVPFNPMDIDTVLDRINEDKLIQSGQNSFVALTNASIDDNLVDKHEVAQKTHKICTLSWPMPPPSDDEKLARQLHRAMNSSPRISRSRACLEYYRKIETSPFLIDGWNQIRYPRSSSMKKSRIHKAKQWVSRSSTGKADIKIKSMTAINETLNMHQKETFAQYGVLGSTGSCFAASSEYRNALSHKDDDSMPDVSNFALVSLTNCNEGRSTSTANRNAGGSQNVCFKTKGITSHRQSIESDEDFTASPRTLRKLNSGRSKQATGSILASTRKDNELLSTCADIQSNAASEQTWSYLESSYYDNYGGSNENDDVVMVSGPGSTAGVNANELPAIKTRQADLFCSKPGRAGQRFSDPSVCGKRPRQGQKILGVLANGLSEGNQNFGNSLSLQLPSPAAS